MEVVLKGLQAVDLLVESVKAAGLLEALSWAHLQAMMRPNYIIIQIG